MRNTAIALLMSASCAIVAAAQAPSTPAQTQAPPPPGSTVTATGCLRAADRPGAFMLTNVKWTSKNVPSGEAAAHHDATPQRDRPTTPATAATGSRELPTAETVRLAGAAERLKLSDHIGHTVSVTGMIAPEDPIVTPAVVLPDGPPKGDTTSRTPKSDRPEKYVLNMRSITHVAAECK
jgi:hypothetical protein